MARRTVLLFPQLVVVTALISAAAGSSYAQEITSYGVVESKDVMIPMRDGVKLAADIYRPARDGYAADGKFPVVLMRTPYNKESSAASATTLVPHGYVVVLEDVRGRYKSEGHWLALATDPEDGYDTAKWIGAQSWCDGGIGTIGSSYAGATQHAMAIAGAPYLKAMIPRNAMSDFGRYGVRHNGAFELSLLQLGVHTRKCDGDAERSPGRQARCFRSRRSRSTSTDGQRCSAVRPQPATAAGNYPAEVRSGLREVAGGSDESWRLRQLLEECRLQRD